MCKVVINKLTLGARELGYELFDGKQIIEMTGSQIIRAIKSGEEIRGVKVGGNEELELDREGFFTRNLMVKSHINNFKPLIEEDGSVAANIFYIVLGSKTVNSKTVYPVITTRFGREELTEEKLKALYELGLISAGVEITNDQITLPTRHIKPVADREAAKVQEEAVQAGKGITDARKKASPEKNETAK